MSKSKNLRNMNRYELQCLAKKNGLKANLKSEDLIKRLEKYRDKENLIPLTTSTSSSSSPPPTPKENHKKRKRLSSSPCAPTTPAKKIKKCEISSSSSTSPVPSPSPRKHVVTVVPSVSSSSSPLPTPAKRRKIDKSFATPTPKKTGTGISDTPSKSSSPFQVPPKKTPLSDKKSNITIPESPFMKKLGNGSDVCVYRLERKEQSPWAIKRLTKQANETMYKRLKAEANILKTLCHPNIVGFRGLSTTSDGRLALHLECCTTSLLTLLDALRIPPPQEPPPPFPAHKITTVALHTARALNYLHTKHCLLHADMKPDNILITGDFEIIKICDFGVSLKLKKGLIGQVHPKKEVYLGTDQYLPWETIHGTSNDVTDRADIYAFGLVLWEMITIQIPHEHVLRKKGAERNDDSDSDDSEDSGMEEYEKLLGTCPIIPKGLSKEYNQVVKLIKCCCNKQWKKRPSAATVIKMVEKHLKKNKNL